MIFSVPRALFFADVRNVPQSGDTRTLGRAVGGARPMASLQNPTPPTNPSPSTPPQKEPGEGKGRGKRRGRERGGGTQKGEIR